MKIGDFILLLETLMAICLCATARAAIIPGHVEAWGYNFFSQAVPPPGLDGVVAIAAGGNHSLALCTNGTVVGWGYNGEGQATVPAGLSDVMAIAARSHSVALKRNGTVMVWGHNLAAVTSVPATATQVMAIAAGNLAGNSYTVALRSNGTVLAWGLSSFATNVPVGLTGVVGIAAGNNHVLALKNDGTVTAWGENNVGQATPPPGLNGVVAVRAGQSTSFAVKSDGTVVEWGGNDLPPGLTGVIDVQLGAQHGLALRANGDVIAWGNNSHGQGTVPVGLSNVSAISAGGNHNLVITPRPIVFFISSPIVTNVGATVTFSANASGGELSYQWQHNNSDLPGATNTSLTITNVQPADAGTYRVRVSNAYGAVFSSLTSLSFPPPVITAQPQSLTLYRGENAVFNVTTEGLAPLAYQWRRNATNLPGANSAMLIQPTVRSNDAGAYSVVITDVAGGSVTSAVATLTVIGPTAPVSLTLAPLMDTSIYSSGVNPQGAGTILAGTRNNGIIDRGLLRFALSSIPAEAVIGSARLRLQVVRVPRSPANSDFGLHRMKKPWANDATWGNATAGTPWAAPGGMSDVDFVGTASASRFVTGGGIYDFAAPQLIADLEAWRGNPGTNSGWLLRSASEGTAGTARHFGASESTQPPQLEITYFTPAPAPQLTGVRLQGTNIAFDFNGAPGWIYRVEFRDDVDHGPWTTITNIPAGSGTNVLSVAAPVATARRFYRVIAE